MAFLVQFLCAQNLYPNDKCTPAIRLSLKNFLFEKLLVSFLFMIDLTLFLSLVHCSVAYITIQ